MSNPTAPTLPFRVAMLSVQLPQSDQGRCIRCRCWFYYQRADPPRHPVHFYFCRRCGSRYAAWETGWMPGGRADRYARRRRQAVLFGPPRPR
jgi:hypothetical protein